MFNHYIFCKGLLNAPERSSEPIGNFSVGLWHFIGVGTSQINGSLLSFFSLHVPRILLRLHLMHCAPSLYSSLLRYHLSTGPELGNSVLGRVLLLTEA